jgi:hypothetical protein
MHSRISRSICVFTCAPHKGLWLPELCCAQSEAERFVTRPFLMGTHDAPQARPSPMQQGAAERVQRAELASRKTTSVFSPAQSAPILTKTPALLHLWSVHIGPACMHTWKADRP